MRTIVSDLPTAGRKEGGGLEKEREKGRARGKEEGEDSGEGE